MNNKQNKTTTITKVSNRAGSEQRKKNRENTKVALLMAQLERLEDTSALRSSTIRYLFSNVTLDSVEGSMNILEELCPMSVALHRYILRHAFSCCFSASRLLPSAGTTDDGTVVLHTNYSIMSKEEVNEKNPPGNKLQDNKEANKALIKLTKLLVLFTLHQSNATTLLGGALDFLAPPPTSSSFTSSSLTSSRVGRFATSNVLSPLSPGACSLPSAAGVTSIPAEVVRDFLKQKLELTDAELFRFAAALSLGSAVPAVRDAASSILLGIDSKSVKAKGKEVLIFWQLMFLHKASSSTSTSFSNSRSTGETNSSFLPPLTKAFEEQVKALPRSMTKPSVKGFMGVSAVRLCEEMPIDVIERRRRISASAYSSQPLSPPIAAIFPKAFDCVGDPFHFPMYPDFIPHGTNVSIGKILREVGTGCVTTTADSKELLRLLGKKITEEDIAEVLGFFASSAMTNVNDPSAYRMLSAIFSSIPSVGEAEGGTDADGASRGGRSGGSATMNSTSTNAASITTGSHNSSTGSTTNGMTQLGMMMMSSGGGGGSGVVNARPLLDAMHTSGNSYDWDKVICLLDVPDEDGFEPSTVSVIFDAYHSFHKKTVCKSSGAAGSSASSSGSAGGLSSNITPQNISAASSGREYPPITLFLGHWKNTKRQRSALMFILQNPEKCNIKVLEELAVGSDSVTQGVEGEKALLPEALMQAIRDDHSAATAATATASTSVLASSSTNRGIFGSSTNTGTGGNGSIFTSSSSTSLLSSLSALHLWGSPPFMEAALHVASRETRFDQEVLQPAVRTIPLLFLYVLFGNPQLKYSMKGLTVLKNILSNSAYRPSVERMTTFILPQAEKSGNMSAWINLLSELTVSQPLTVVEVLEMVTHVKPLKLVLQTSSSPRLVVGLAMCMEEVTKSGSAGCPGSSDGHTSKPTAAGSQKKENDPWLHRALDGRLKFTASSTENRFVVAMYIVEIAEMLLAKNRFRESATNALHAFLNSSLKDMLPNIAESARGLLASVDFLFPPAVEKASDAIFVEMYKFGTIETAISRVKGLRESSEPVSKEIYSCLVHIMFDEAASIHHYPPKELQLFGQLFGRLMAEDLLPEAQVARAWSLLLSAIVKPPNDATKEYGICALKEIKSRLAEWPQYCRAIRNVKDLDFRIPGVMATIYRGIKEEAQATSAANAAAAATSAAGAAGGESGSNTTGKTVVVPKKSAFIDPAIISVSNAPGGRDEGKQSLHLHTLNIKAILADGSITSPPPVIQDQINFLVSNTDAKNIQRHAEDMAVQLRPEYYEYFAHYLVVKRAALEPNNHALYIDLVDRLKSKELNKAIRIATVSAVKRLLGSQKISSSVADEWTLLGNLGLWLGGITIQKNIPLLAVELDFEALLAQALREERLAATTKLMSRVLESCSKSALFAPPNPWTMSQLSLFLQVYNLPKLKQRIRLELDILLTKLNLSISNLKSFAARFQQSRSRLRHPPLLQTAYEILDRTQPHLDFAEQQPPPSQVAPVMTNEPDSRAGSASVSRGQASYPESSLGGSTRSGSQRTSNLQPTAEPFQPHRQEASPGTSPGMDFAGRSAGGVTAAPPQGSPRTSALPNAASAGGMPSDASPPAPSPPVQSSSPPHGSSVPLPRDFGDRHERPRIELTRERIQVPAALEEFSVSPEKYQAQAFRMLQEAMRRWLQQVRPAAKRAVLCTSQLLFKERVLEAPSPMREKAIEGSFFMVRSLAANECFFNVKKDIPEVARANMMQLLIKMRKLGLEAGSSPPLTELNAAEREKEEETIQLCMLKIMEPFLTDCENLCLRVLEYEAGQLAVEQLRDALEKEIRTIPTNPLQIAGLPMVIQSFKDFVYCFPASNSFIQALRKVEDMVNRKIPSSPEGGNGESSKLSGADPKSGNLSATSVGPSEQGTVLWTNTGPRASPFSFPHAPIDFPLHLEEHFYLEKKNLEDLITYESAVYIAGPMVLRLFAAARLDEDRKKEKGNSDGKSSLFASPAGSNNTSVMNNSMGPPTTQAGGSGASSPSINLPQQQVAGGVRNLPNSSTGAASRGPDNTATGSVVAPSSAVLAEDGASEMARRKKVSMVVWNLYLHILVTCFSRNKDAVIEEISTVFLQHEGRYGHYNLVVDLLRLELIDSARLDADLLSLFRAPEMRAQLFEFVGKIVLSDRVLKPCQIKNTVLAIGEVVGHPGPPHYRASPFLSKPIMYTVGKDIQKLIMPIDLLVNSEKAYLEISQEFETWIAVKRMHRSVNPGSSQPVFSSNSIEGPSSLDGTGENAANNNRGSSNAKAGPSSSTEGSPSDQPWSQSYVQHLQAKGYLECSRLQLFLHSLVCLCIEDHATRVLNQERVTSMSDKVRDSSSADLGPRDTAPLLNPDPWSPPTLQALYDPTVFTKCDYFLALFGVLLRCVSTHPDEANTDQRADLTLLRRVLDSICRVLQHHHSAAAMLNKWKHPKLRFPPPANTAYIPVFMQQPYVRILSNLLFQIQSFKSDFVLTRPFLNTLHVLNPTDYPGFAFGWLELVSHRLLLHRTLREYKGILWDAYAGLLVDALRFISQRGARETRLPGTVLFFKAYEKLMIVIHHDFPHFFLAQNYLLYSATPQQYLHLLNLYNVRILPQKTLPPSSSNSLVGSSPSLSEGAVGEPRGGGSGSGEEKEERLTPSQVHRHLITNHGIMAPMYPFLPIEAVMKDLETTTYGFGRNLGLLEAWTAALTAQAARNRDIFREHPYGDGSTADPGNPVAGRNPLISPGSTVVNAVLSPGVLKGIVDHLKGNTSSKLLHALGLQAFFITAGISLPQLRWAAAHSTDGDGGALSEEDKKKRLEKLIWDSSAAMPPKFHQEVLSKNPLAPVLRFFRYLCENVDPARRYFFLHACAQHLRTKDSSETIFFSEVFAFLFSTPPGMTSEENSDSPSSIPGSSIPGGSNADGNNGNKKNLSNLSAEEIAARRIQTGIEEQVLRVLLERLLTNRPQPDGVLTALRTLMKDKDFKQKEFSREFKRVLGKRYGTRPPQQEQQQQQQQSVSGPR